MVVHWCTGNLRYRFSIFISRAFLSIKKCKIKNNNTSTTKRGFTMGIFTAIVFTVILCFLVKRSVTGPREIFSRWMLGLYFSFGVLNNVAYYMDWILLTNISPTICLFISLMIICWFAAVYFDIVDRIIGASPWIHPWGLADGKCS
jgi:hypothetical protein